MAVADALKNAGTLCDPEKIGGWSSPMLNGLDQVSVVIPVLNARAALNALLRALTPFRDLEIVVVDGGSEEGSMDELQPRYDSSRGKRGRALQLRAGVEARSDLGFGFYTQIAR
ncbi:MAG: hypothetical protein CM1200mP9_03980 [Gammaproteobacteria bacterium]|nr:MAG: hypothetical protein CM1200mP9_03980 [Gammaproteobacteria bacterium]